MAENKHIIDMPLYRNGTPGHIFTHNPIEKDEALKQSILIWLLSSKQEKVRSDGGGILYKYVGSLLDNDTARNIAADIRYGLATEFEIPLDIILLDVIPDVESKTWTVNLVAVSPEYNVGVNASYDLQL